MLLVRFGLILGAIKLGVAMLRKLHHPACPPPVEPGAPVPPMSDGELEAFYLLAADNAPDAVDWRKSIVDKLKILRLDSGFDFRRDLWAEMGHTDRYTGSAEQNEQLLADVDKKIAAREPIVP